jgi:hypothetical protein
MVDGSTPTDGNQVLCGPAGLDRLVEGTPRDLRTLQVKLTHIGTQRKPVAAVIFTTFYHIARLDWFQPLRQAGSNHVDDGDWVWNFVVTPEEMQTVVAALGRSEAVRDARRPAAPFLSLMLALRASRIGDITVEALLARDAAATVIETLQAALTSDNGVGRRVLELQRQALFGPTP